VATVLENGEIYAFWTVTHFWSDYVTDNSNWYFVNFYPVAWPLVAKLSFTDNLRKTKLILLGALRPAMVKTCLICLVLLYVPTSVPFTEKMKQNHVTSVAEPRNCDAAPAPCENLDAAPDPTLSVTC
jgi:hypothetical protein